MTTIKQNTVVEVSHDLQALHNAISKAVYQLYQLIMASGEEQRPSTTIRPSLISSAKVDSGINLGSPSPDRENVIHSQVTNTLSKLSESMSDQEHVCIILYLVFFLIQDLLWIYISRRV